MQIMVVLNQNLDSRVKGYWHKLLCFQTQLRNDDAHRGLFRFWKFAAKCSVIIPIVQYIILHDAVKTRGKQK